MNTLYRIAYVDESLSDIRKFQRYADGFFEVIGIEPSPEIDITIEEILENKVDALVADFDLKEQNRSITYYGTDLVVKFLEKRRNFPIFIFTSHEDDALERGDDVNIIYEKSIQYFNNLDDTLPPIKNNKLLEKVKFQIDKYQFKIAQSEERLLELLEKSKNGTIDSIEEEEILQLDSEIEKSLDGGSIIPNLIKNRNEYSKLTELLIKVDLLAKKIENQQ